MRRRRGIRGSINYQVNQIFLKSEIFTPGLSKHTAKVKARTEGAKTWADIGKHINIYSYSTAQSYKDIWHQFGHFAKTELGVRDIENIKGEHVRTYLESRIADGVKYATFQKEAAALSKFERAINGFAEKTESGQHYDFRSSMKDVRQEAAQTLERFQETRSYVDPGQLIKNIDNKSYQIAACIQHESGARLYESSLIHSNQLESIGKDIAGCEVGRVRLDPADTKGGKGRTIFLSLETYHRLEMHIAEHGEFRISNANGYREALKAAAEQSNPKYTGSHGLRWNYAQERFSELQKAGYTHEQCLSQTSWNMGHERADITLHYLQ